MSEGKTDFVQRVTVDDDIIKKLAERIVHSLQLPDPAEAV